MRSYDTRVAALAIRAPAKWIDNLLSQHEIVEVVCSQRGVTRRISFPALVHLAVTHELHDALGMGVRDALELSRALLSSAQDAGVQTGHLRIALDRNALERTLNVRLREVLESAPTPRRGRPPRRHVPE